METMRDEGSLRRPVNAVILGILLAAGILSAWRVGFSWKTVGFGAVAGVLMGMLYSPRRFWLRLLALMVLIFGMAAVRVSGPTHSLGRDILVDTQFLAIALLLALAVGSARRIR